jgi:hypothetical protein
MLELHKNTAEYTILQTSSIVRLLNLKHHAPQCGDDPSTIRAQFLINSQKRRFQMKRALLMASLAVSLTFGLGRAYAFPVNPCVQTAGQSAASGPSQLQLFWLLLPALTSPIV